MTRRYGALQRAISDLGSDIEIVLNQMNTRIRELEEQVEVLKKLDSLAQLPTERRWAPPTTQEQ